jgi:hypothetical protein
VLDGPINGAAFLAYVEQVLAPELSPGYIVVMENLGSHKGKAHPLRRLQPTGMRQPLQSRWIRSGLR